VRGRGARSEPVLAWSETGRSAALTGTLAGLSGAPALDGAGRIIGVTVAEAPRRGRIYTTAPETVRATLAAAAPAPDLARPLAPITPDNYGQVAKELRRNLRVAQVMCLT
ncbi:MAG: serine protease, partial [Phenylobacterium sp.]